jgi:hypothetical protein
MQPNTENQFDDNMTIHEALIRLWRSRQAIKDWQQNIEETRQACEALESWLSERVEPDKVLLIPELQEQGYVAQTLTKINDPGQIPMTFSEPIIRFEPCQICDETYQGRTSENYDLGDFLGTYIDE